MKKNKDHFINEFMNITTTYLTNLMQKILLTINSYCQFKLITMSFDISSSFYQTHDSSIATIQFLTQSNQLSPIRVLDSATSSNITPKVLFQSYNHSPHLQSGKINAGKNYENRQLNRNPKNGYFSLMEHSQMCESFEFQPNQLKCNNQNKEQNIVQQPQIYEGNSRHMPHMMKLFNQSQIQSIKQQSQHHLSVKFQQSRKQGEEEFEWKSTESVGYLYAMQQLKQMSENVQKINLILANSEFKKQLSSSSRNINLANIRIANVPFISSVEPVHSSHQKLLETIDAKSTKSQEVKNIGAECESAISQFHNNFKINEQDLSDLSPISKVSQFKYERQFNTSQNSSKMLMRRKMNHSHLSKDLFSA